MTYIINNSIGSIIAQVADTSIDQTSTDLTLIGKNVSGYGEYINENFIKLLENFASSSQPTNPIAGQIWYDTASGRLKVYNGTGFGVGSGPIVSATQPDTATLVEGDLWINSAENQMYFYDGVDLQLAGPIWGYSQGLSGFETVTIIDSNLQERVCVKLWCGQTLLGIFSKHTEFTPLNPIVGFSGNVKKGFTPGSLSGQKFYVTASSADALIDTLGNSKGVSSFMLTEDNTATVGTVTIQNSTPLIIGPNQNNEIRVSLLTYETVSNIAGQDYKIRTKTEAGLFDALTIKALSQRVGIFTATPTATLDVGGDVYISGNLTVDGATTSIQTTTLQIEDKNIELAKVNVPTDTTANGAGITVLGSTDKTFNWLSSTSSWTSSENINLASGKTFKINGVDVLTGTSLGIGITSAPGITSFGPQTSITVDNLFLNDNRISSTNANGDVEIEPNGTGNLSLIGNPKITGLAAPTSSTDAANKTYVDTTVRSRSVGLAVDISDFAPGVVNAKLVLILTDVFPPGGYEVGTYARVHCTSFAASFPAIDVASQINRTFTTVLSNDGSTTENVLQDFGVNPVPTGSATVTVVRSLKRFVINGSGAWQFDADLVSSV